MIRILIFVLFSFVYGVLPGHVLAAAVGDSFIISSFVGVDLNPPTTPILQTVVPVAPTQINLAWLPSTDDVFLMGYRVYRDGLPIATTTLTTFSDTGLSPSTTYNYTVDAYDNYGNVSSSSAMLATTTFALPIPPATTTLATSSSSGGVSSVPTLRVMTVTPDRISALIQWQTFGPTRYTISWGRTSNYEMGTVSSNVFEQQHQTTLTDLEPGTRYFFQVTAIDGRGVSRVIATDSFTTIAQVSTNSPVNVRLFSALVRESDVTLRWENPEPLDGVVRIVRSHLFYPQSPQDGALIYEGTNEGVTDISALLNRSPQFYTAFIITPEGLVSSGAIVRVERKEAADVTPPLVDNESPEPEYQESGEVTILRATDVIIAQGVHIWRMDMPLTLEAHTETLIRIPVDRVVRNLKSIIVSLESPTDQRQVSSYLLKLNQSGDAYEALVPAPLVVGRARLTVEVFDYTEETVRRVSTMITFTDEVNSNESISTSEIYRWLIILMVGVVGVLLSWWFFLSKRRRSDEDNH